MTTHRSNLTADSQEVKDYLKERRGHHKREEKKKDKEEPLFTIDPMIKDAIREQTGYEHIEKPVTEALNKLLRTNERQDIEIEDYKITAYRIESQKLIRIDVRQK